MIKPLDQVPLEILYDAFVDAFSNYEAKIDLSPGQFQDMLETRSFAAEYSRGDFDGQDLTGFLLVGFREERGERLFYDTATGVRKAYQGRGIAGELVKSVIQEMAERNIHRFILEVLEHNTAARELYTKNGFRISRKLSCFRYTPEGPVPEDQHIVFVLNGEVFEKPGDLCGFRPSWQNSNASYLNSQKQNRKLDIQIQDRFAGYLILDIHTGNILQLGLKEEYRRAETVDGILKKIRQDYKPAGIKILNVESESGMDLLFKAAGMENFLNQYEMEYTRQPDGRI